MQGVPSGLDVPRIEEKISKLEGVIAVHDLHIWQLDEERCVASVHVVCKDRDVWQTLGPKVRGILHKNGIHSATIQHEFESDVATPRKTEDAGEPEKKSDEEEVITLNNSACLAPCSPDCTDLRCCDE
jgi:zinc transporter 1